MIPFPNKTYSIIYADPPYDYRGQTQHTHAKKYWAQDSFFGTGGASTHYGTLSQQDLWELPVKDIAEKDCLLFLWTTNPHLEEAVLLGKKWGFKYMTIAFVWNKLITNPGYYTISQCEECLVFKKGKIPQPRGAKNIRQYVEERRGKHSTKPSEVRKRIELMFPTQSKIELFAREQVPGWDCWGNEV